MTKKEHPKQFGLLGKNIDYSFSRSYFSKKFTNENGKIIPQRVTNMSRSIHTKITKAIKQARFLSLM